MKRTALVTMLILGSSSVALARPATVSVRAEASWSTSFGGADIRDHRTKRPRPAPVSNPYQQRNRWEVNAFYTTPSYGTAVGRSISFGDDVTRTVYVGSQLGSFKQIKLTATAGRPKIQQVFVQFADGGEAAFHNLNTTLTNAPLTLTLQGNARPIAKIVVYAPAYGQARPENFAYETGSFMVSVL
jgi:hypothetical protein